MSPIVPKKGSNSAADFSVFDPFSQPESAFRENVWQSGARNRVPKNGRVYGAYQGGTYRSFDGVPAKGLRLWESGRCNDQIRQRRRRRDRDGPSEPRTRLTLARKKNAVSLRTALRRDVPNIAQ